ncbi:hypothetical protein EDD22DRAFT_965761 [Suillus occidentalis]|nr:hypothetical protein EDD22DRAFT_965761 [Suillus occidentalis]
MYYIAGLTIQIPPQAVEGLAVFTTLRFIQYSVSRARAIAAVAKVESGAIRTRPTTFIGRIVTPIHLVTSSISSMTYVLCIRRQHQETKVALENRGMRIDLCTSQRREKPRVVQTGPYAVVRHPLYTQMLMQQALAAVMFWSYAPLVGFGIIAGALSIKIPIEEDLILSDPAIATEYRAYMQKVPARVIPFLW